ncbi:MAG: SpoIIE family protein phosphatase [Pseudomonadota bacterium]
MGDKPAAVFTFKGISLSLKILLPLIFFTSLIIISFAAYLIKDQRIQREALLEAKAENIKYLLSQSYIDALWNYNFEQLENLSQSFFKDQDIIHLVIKDHRGNIQAKLDKEIKGSQEILKTSEIKKDEEHIGDLEIVFTNFHIEQDLTQIKHRITILAMVLFFILTLVILLISRFIILRPIAKVLEGMSHVSKGHYNYQINLSSNDEIAQLATGFNTMSKQIIGFQNQAVAMAGSRKEMEIAKNIQMSLQPSLEKFKTCGFQISANMTPAEDVGGDYYDLIYSCDHKLWFGIGDVTGHGLLSGLVMMMAQVAINTLIRSIPGLTPEEVLIYANQTIQANIRDSLKKDHHMTITFIKEEKKGLYRYAGAHEIILIYRAKSQQIEQIQTRGMWLGVVPDITKPTRKYAGTFELEPDDILFLYTDGVIEIKNRDSQQYDISRLSHFLISHASLDPRTIKLKLLSELNHFKEKQQDDITFIIMKKE